jgi:histidyl-tRNA synthetase
VTLARGLNYYTGMIVEVKAPEAVKMGSIGGGGRYDDLTGLFGLPGLSGVGISFGVDRIYDVLEELQLFPATAQQGTQVLFFNLDQETTGTAFKLVMQLRAKGVSSELFHETSKMDKQMKYANKRNIPYVIIMGESEVKEGLVSIKNMVTGQQEKIAMTELANYQF